MPSYFTSVVKCHEILNSNADATAHYYGWQGPEGDFALVLVHDAPDPIWGNNVEEYFIVSPANTRRSLWTMRAADVADADVATRWPHLDVPAVSFRTHMVQAFIADDKGPVYAGLMWKGLMISQGDTTCIIMDDFSPWPRQLHVWTGDANGDYPDVFDGKCEARIELTSDEWAVADAATMMVMDNDSDVFDDLETVEAEVAEYKALDDHDLMDDDLEDDEHYYS